MVNDSGDVVSDPKCIVETPQESTKPRAPSQMSGVGVGGIVGISFAIIVIVVCVSVIIGGIVLLKKHKNNKRSQEIKNLTLVQRYALIYVCAI